MAEQQANITFDPATGKIVELVPQEVSGDFQADLDAAQNRLNSANEAVPAREQAYTDSVTAVEAASLALEDARKEVELANEEVAFQAHRKEAFDAAVQVRDELAQSNPEGEFTEDPTGDASESAESGAVSVPVTVAPTAEV